MRKISSVLQSNCLREDHSSFLRQLRVNPLRPSNGGGKSSTGKEDSFEFKGPMSPGPSMSPHMFPSQLPGPCSFPVHFLTLPVDTPQGWEFNFHCDSAISRRDSGFVLSILSPVAIGDKGLYQSRCRSFQVTYVALELGLRILEAHPIFFFPLLSPATLGATSQSHYTC